MDLEQTRTVREPQTTCVFKSKTYSWPEQTWNGLGTDLDSTGTLKNLRFLTYGSKRTVEPNMAYSYIGVPTTFWLSVHTPWLTWVLKQVSANNLYTLELLRCPKQLVQSRFRGYSAPAPFFGQSRGWVYRSIRWERTWTAPGPQHSIF